MTPLKYITLAKLMKIFDVGKVQAYNIIKQENIKTFKFKRRTDRIRYLESEVRQVNNDRKNTLVEKS